MTDIIVPADMWEEDVEGVIVSWLYNDGAQIEEGKPVAEVMVEKIQSDVLAPASGTLSIVEPADTVVKKGQVIGKVG